MEVNVTATGTPNVFNVTVAQSGSGGQGPKGDKGWSPMIRTAEDGNRQVLELYDWTGGQGTKPTTVGYLSPTGLTADIAEATNIKGDSGGIGSVNWGQVGGLLSDQADLWSELGGKATPQDIVDALNGLELGSAAFTDASDYATSTQGAKADTALQPESEWFGTLSQYTALPSDKLTNGVEHFIEADPQP